MAFSDSVFVRAGNALAVKLMDAPFLGEGAPITFIGLDGQDRTGHAVANRDERGRVSVTAQLDLV